MIKVMHVITTLGPAGAETMLTRLVSGMDGTTFENEIVSLTGILDLADNMRAIGVPVRSLGMKKRLPNPLLVLRLARWIRQSKPDVIHAWMYHANLIGALAASLAGSVPVIWGIHHTTFDPRVDRRRTMFVNRACAFLSQGFAARIVCCSEASLRVHKELSYPADKLEVIPNGCDPERIKPDPAARVSVREELDIPSDAILIGIAARFHPHKDHPNFIHAAALLHNQMPQVHFLLCGLNITRENSQLTRWIEEAGIGDRCHLLGLCQDMPRFFAALDIATTSSCSEAFPVVIGEAMACGTPCVVTNVGDSALIVDKTGLVVPPQNPEALSRAWRQLIMAGPEVRRILGLAARRRVQQHFALTETVKRYQAVYTELAARRLGGLCSPGLSECVR